MSDGGLVAVLQAGDVLVEVSHTPGQGLGNVAQLVPGHDVGLQVISQRALERRHTNTHTHAFI